MKNINFHSCLKVDGKIWFVSVEGYLMNFDIHTYQSKIVAPHNLPELRFKQVIDDMVSANSQIYFVEQDGSKLYEYNWVTNECAYYLIPDTQYINYGCFSGIYLLGQTIYLFTRTMGVIHCFDIIRKKFTSIAEKKKDLVMNSFRIQNKVFLYGKKVICFDMDRNSFGEESCFGEGDILWMEPYRNVILFLTKDRMGIWSRDGQSKEILYEEDKLAEKYLAFVTTVNKIFLLSNQSKNILILNPETGETSYAVLPKDLYYIEKGWSKYWGYTEDDRYIWCANRVSNYVLSIDKEKEEIRWIKLRKPDVKAEIPYLKLLDKSVFDEKEMTLEQFLLIDNTGLQKNKRSCGKKIWGSLKE